MSRRVRVLVFLGGAAVFAYLVSQADLRAVASNLHAAGRTVAAIVVVFGVVYLTNTFAWRLTMTDPATRIPFWRAYVISVAGFALNYVTPFVNLGGEPYKIAVAAQWLGPRRAASSSLTFRLLHMIAHLVFFMTTVVLAYVLLPSSVLAGSVMTVVTIVLVALMVLLLSINRRGGVERIRQLLHRLPLPARWIAWLESQEEAFVEIDKQLVEFYRESPGRFYLAMFAEYVGRCISVLEFWFISRALGAPVSYAASYLIGGFSSLVMNVFFFVPLEIGPKEGGLYLIFQLLGFPASLGVTASLVSRIREFVWIGIGLAMVLLTGKKEVATKALEGEAEER